MTAGAPAITSLFQGGGRREKGQGQRIFPELPTSDFCLYLLAPSSCDLLDGCLAVFNSDVSLLVWYGGGGEGYC